MYYLRKSAIIIGNNGNVCNIMQSVDWPTKISLSDNILCVIVAFGESHELR
jgi:hypothetical protein